MVERFIGKRLTRHIVRVASVLAVGLLLAGCTGRGGGWLPPDGVVFSSQASFGFSFSCERSSNSYNTTPPTGRLRIQLQYTEKGTNILHGPFSIHGEVDKLDPVVESAICIGQEPPPGRNELIFLGRYRVTAWGGARFPAECQSTTTDLTTSQCRFEVVVRDNDRNYVPSTGDYFSLKLSGSSSLVSEFDDSTPVLYVRAGNVGGGNVKVD